MKTQVPHIFSLYHHIYPLVKAEAENRDYDGDWQLNHADLIRRVRLRVGQTNDSTKVKAEAKKAAEAKIARKAADVTKRLRRDLA